MSTTYLYDFDPAAENNTAATIYRMVAAGGTRVLDLGSGPGIVASALQRREGKAVTCLDVDEDALAAAREAGVVRTVVADLDADAWVGELDGEQFDVIVLADVLEHLYAPGRVLDLISERSLLASGGFLVVSIPNAAHEAVIGSLVAGDFTYTRTGLLDATHIRFFTRETFRALCEEHGYTVARLERTTRTLEQTELSPLAPEVATALRRSLVESNADHRTYQYIAKVVPLTEPGRLVELHERVAQLRAERLEAVEEVRRDKRAVEERLAEARTLQSRAEEALAQARREAADAAERAAEREAEVRRLGGRLAALEEELDERAATVASQREELERLQHEDDERSQELASLGRQVDTLRRERDIVSSKERAARRKLEQVYASETWKAGRAVLWAPGRLKAAARRLGRPRADDPPAPAVTSPAEAVAGPALHVTEHAELHLTEHAALREAYESAVAKRRFTTGATHVVMAVSTTDLSEGRGDLYTAVGLGRHLEPLGYEVVYLGKDDWYDLPEGTDVFVSMLAERTAMVDPLALPSDCTRLAWVRNVTERWTDSPTLAFYDGLLCSSVATMRALRRVYPGPVEILRMGVDDELFRPPDEAGRQPVAVSTVNAWGSQRDLHAALLAIDRDFPLALYGQQRGTPEPLLPHTRNPASFFSLPSLYGQAAVVLDDEQDVNRPYGNVNSRVFEALSCGALPISNSRLGLEDVGLADLPVYDTPQDLHRLVRHHLERTDEREQLVARLRAAVAERHTYRRRAQEFHAFVNGPLADRPGRAAARTVIGFMPDYRATNPFQEMLYSRAAEHGALAVPTDDPGAILDSPALGDRSFVFHLHWTAPILGPAASRRGADERRRAFVAVLDSLRARGVAIVWTVHNAMPHECAFPDVERRLRADIVARADAVHVLCAETPELVAEHVEIPPDKVHVIRHGSYVDYYANAVDAARARLELGLSRDDTVLLCLGGIRPYKGIDALLDAFDVVAAERPGLRLVVAGRPGRFRGVEALRARCESNPRVLAYFHEVPDADLQVYFNAADVVVLPHLRVLNSGGLQLAWSFGRPVVAPRVGCLAGEVTDDLGVTFDPERDELADALRKVPSLLGDDVRRACFRRAQSYPFTQMSADYFSFLADLQSRPERATSGGGSPDPRP